MILIYINTNYFYSSCRVEVNHARDKSDIFPWFLPGYPEILIKFWFFPDIFQEIQIFWFLLDFFDLADTLLHSETSQ